MAKVVKLWQQERPIVDKAAAVVASATLNSTGVASGTALSYANLDFAVSRLMDRVDSKYGGLEQSRKYPVPWVLGLFQRQSERRSERQSERQSQGHSQGRSGPAVVARNFVATTLDAMAMRQICDQVGGGFFRYATNEQWRSPHFEKMLSDNALIAAIYMQVGTSQKNSFWLATGRKTVDFILAELCLADGTFAGSIDADTIEGEGMFYTYSTAEARAALPAQCVDRFISFSNFTDVDGLDALEKFRTSRTRPHRDDRVIAAWNGMAISALIEAHKAGLQSNQFDSERYLNKRYLPAAQKACHSLLRKLYAQDILHHAEGSGAVAYLDDYAFVEKALLDLYTVDHDLHWLKLAEQMNATVLSEYFHSATNSFSYTKLSQNNLLSATTDGTVPSGAAAAIENIIRLVRLKRDEGSKRQLLLARSVLQTCSGAMQAEPQRYASMLVALESLLQAER